MTPEQIAAEVAARYGVPVNPAVVKVLPARVVVEPSFVWSEKTQTLVAKEGLSQTLRRTIQAQTEAAKAARRRGNIANGMRLAEEKRRRVAALRKWAGDGVTLAALAEHMGVKMSTAERYARECKLPIIRDRRIPTPDQLAERRAKVAELRKRGLSIAQICIELDAGTKAIRHDLQVLGLAA